MYGRGVEGGSGFVRKLWLPTLVLLAVTQAWSDLRLPPSLGELQRGTSRVRQDSHEFLVNSFCFSDDA